MARGLDDVPRGALLDDPAEVHDADAIGEASGRREIVRDHEDRQTAIAQLVEDREDARADGDVEHRDGLVGDEEIGLQRQARGECDPLPLASGELVRKPLREELRRREPDLLERMVHRHAPLGARADLVDQERLRDGRRHAEAGIQRLVRILVDDLHPAAKPAQIVVRERRDVDPVEAHASRLRRDEPENRLRGRRLAAARLADERDHLAPSHAERDAGDRMHVPVRAAKERTAQPARHAVADDQVLDLEQRPAVAHRAAHLTTSSELAK